MAAADDYGMTFSEVAEDRLRDPPLYPLHCSPTSLDSRIRMLDGGKSEFGQHSKRMVLRVSSCLVADVLRCMVVHHSTASPARWTWRGAP